MHSDFRRPTVVGQQFSRRLLLALTVCCLLAFVACGGNNAPQVSSETGTPTGPAPPRTMYPMPPVNSSGSATANAQTFTMLDNRRVRVSDYVGKVVVLDFYATWCGPCRVATPHLVELHRRYNSQGLHIIGLNVGGPEDRDKVPDYVTEFKIAYTLGYPDPAMSDLYLSDDNSIPQAFVFDRKGRLVKRFISYNDSMPAELERIIQESLAQ